MKTFEIDFTKFEQTDSGTPPQQDILFGQKGKLKTIGTITKYTLTYDETVKGKVKTKTKTHLYEVVFTLDGQRNLFVVVNEEAPARLAHKIEYKHFANDFKSLSSGSSLMELRSSPKPLFLGVYNAPTARKALAKAHEMLIEFIETGIDFGEKTQEYYESLKKKI